MTALSLPHKTQVWILRLSVAEAETGSVKCFCSVYIYDCLYAAGKKE